MALGSRENSSENHFILWLSAVVIGDEEKMVMCSFGADVHKQVQPSRDRASETNHSNESNTTASNSDDKNKEKGTIIEIKIS